MPRNGFGTLFCSPSALFFIEALPASSPSLLAQDSVFFRVFVTIRAMCLFLLSLPVSLSAKSKAAFVYILSLVNNIVKRHSSSCSMDNSIGFKPSFFGKISRYVSLTVNNNGYRIGSVSLLSFSASPSAIFRGVIAVVVNSVKRISWRPFAHIFNKITKAINPAITDCNSSAAVSMILPKIRVIAALFHTLPNGVKGWNFLKWHICSTKIKLPNLSNKCTVMVVGG